MSIMCKHGLYLCHRGECHNDVKRKGAHYRDTHKAIDCRNAMCLTHEIRVVNGMLVSVKP